MGIEAVWRDEQGVELGRVSDPKMILSRLTNITSGFSHTACLRFLDPYGDACFNQLQLPILAEELRVTASMEAEPAVSQHLQELLALVERATNQVHTYLWFIGD
jgi:hypothetical protein